MPLEVPDERVEQEGDHARGEEQEQDVPEEPGEHPDDEQSDRQAHELDPPRHADRRYRRARRRCHGPGS